MTKPLDDMFEKDAGILDFLSPTRAVEKLVVGDEKKPAPARLEDQMTDELFDPVHDAEMRRIRMQAMLNDFLANDPVISTYDPDEVLDAFNQVSQLVPRASAQPAVMRGQLRKLLQQTNAMEPFEANQLVDVEKGLKTVQEPSTLPLAKPPGKE